MSTFTQVGSSTNLPSSRFTSPEQEAYTNGESALKEAENKVHNLVEVIRSDRNAPVDSDLYPMPYNVTYSLPLLEVILEEKSHQLSLLPSVFRDQGRRSGMEDADFLHDFPEGMLLGVFDGHNGNAVSSFAQNYFTYHGKAQVEQFGVVSGLEKLFSEAQKAIKNSCEELHAQGSTAVVCYINKLTHAVYTATLGDSEAAVFRWNKETAAMDYIPLSCARNWQSPEDLERAKPYVPSNIFQMWARVQDPKRLRINKLNVSRALGDLHILPVSSEPVVSLNMLQERDLLVLACDGLWDIVTPGEVGEYLKSIYHRAWDAKDAAATLGTMALTLGNGRDNVTIYVLNVLRKNNS